MPGGWPADREDRPAARSALTPAAMLCRETLSACTSNGDRACRRQCRSARERTTSSCEHPADVVVGSRRDQGRSRGRGHSGGLRSWPRRIQAARFSTQTACVSCRRPCRSADFLDARPYPADWFDVRPSAARAYFGVSRARALRHRTAERRAHRASSRGFPDLDAVKVRSECYLRHRAARRRVGRLVSDDYFAARAAGRSGQGARLDRCRRPDSRIHGGEDCPP